MAWEDYASRGRHRRDSAVLETRKGAPSVGVLPRVHSEGPPDPPGAGLPAEVSHLPWTSKRPQLGGTYRWTGSFWSTTCGHCSWGVGQAKRQEQVARTGSLRGPTPRGQRGLCQSGEDPSRGPGGWTASPAGLPPGWMAPNPPLSRPAPPGFQQHMLLTLPPLYLLDLSAVPSSQS